MSPDLFALCQIVARARLLNCPVCLDTYHMSTPRNSSATISTASSALGDWWSETSRDNLELVLICPNCRQVTPVATNGVAGLIAAFHISNLLELRDTLMKEQKKVEDSSTFFCSFIKVSRSSRRVLEGVHYCDKHQGRELELYCKSCEELICFQCTTAVHHGQTACSIFIKPQVRIWK